MALWHDRVRLRPAGAVRRCFSARLATTSIGYCTLSAKPEIPCGLTSLVGGSSAFRHGDAEAAVQLARGGCHRPPARAGAEYVAALGSGLAISSPRAGGSGGSASRTTVTGSRGVGGGQRVGGCVREGGPIRDRRGARGRPRGRHGASRWSVRNRGGRASRTPLRPGSPSSDRPLGCAGADPEDRCLMPRSGWSDPSVYRTKSLVLGGFAQEHGEISGCSR